MRIASALVLRLCFAPAGRARFARVVEQNVERSLVSLLHGTVLLAPVIDRRSVPECAEITGNVTARETAALQRAIR